MYCRKFNDVETAYRKILNKLFKAKKVGNTQEIPACVIEIKHPSLTNICFPYRKISKKYLDAELKWYWSGSNSCKEIGQYAKKWLNITDDGETNNSAYGYILEKKYGFNQIEQVIELLKEDPNSRRAVLNISDPKIDRIHTKDMQCTVCLQFLIRNNRLITQVYMRSNDIRYGFPYDYVYFMTLATYIASRLDLQLGSYIHHAGSMHLYDSDIDKFAPHTQRFSVDVDELVRKYYNAI